MLCFFFFKQETAYDMRISDWSSDVCSSDPSPLALAQAHELRDRLCAAHPHLEPARIEIVPIQTTGDKVQNRTLAEIGGKGLFTQEIEDALAEGRLDMAGHSMKDMPPEIGRASCRGRGGQAG